STTQQDLPLEVSGAVNVSTGRSNTYQYLLDESNAIQLRWTSNETFNNATAWNRSEQLSWLQVKRSEVLLDVRLSVTGYKTDSGTIDLEVSPQLELQSPETGSPVAEVVETLPGLLRLKLRSNLPADFVLPLHFKLQRSGAVGRIVFPKVRVRGNPPNQELFAVTVAAGLSYDEESSKKLRNIRAAEFAESWGTPEKEPLYAYALTEETPQWSIRVRPDPQTFRAQQSLQVHCRPNAAQVEYEANIDELSGVWLSHQVSVPTSLQIQAVSVQDGLESTAVPIRWTRRSATEVGIFLSRPLRTAHTLVIKGRIKPTANREIELPKIVLPQSKSGELRMDLYRSEETLVNWTDPAHAPPRTAQELIPRNKDELFLGQFSWNSNLVTALSTLSLQRNRQAFQATTLTSVEVGPNGWIARLSGPLAVSQGVVSRLSLNAPTSFREPYTLRPARIGRIDDIVETPRGKEISIKLAEPYATGEAVEIQILGTVALAPDQRLVVPSLHWKGATKQEQYVLLPTLVDGQTLAWRYTGLRRLAALPKRLIGAAPQGQRALPFRVEKQNFEVKEHAYRGDLLNAQVRYLHIDGILDSSGRLSATAEIILQPGRASSCAIQLPPNSEIRQLSIGGRPVRRDLQEGSSWNLPVGPPFMPQRLVLSYRTRPEVSGARLQLVAPQVLLGGQILPAPRSWWKLRATSQFLLDEVPVGNSTTEFQSATNRYFEQLSILEDAIPQALELPDQEAYAWAKTWQPVLQQTQRQWQLFSESLQDNRDLVNQEDALQILAETLGANEESSDRATARTYPPKLPAEPKASPLQKEHFLVSDSQGLLELNITQNSQEGVWHWFAAIAIVSGTLAMTLKLRRFSNWEHSLGNRPHTIALFGGIAWWLMLNPSVLGVLIVALTLTSLALNQWRLFQEQRRNKPSTQLVVPTS
ncbi:MAG: hypothetical protein ACR2NM_17085, partial [Bythopirellula sp.]